MDAYQTALLHDLKTQVGSLIINAQLLVEDLRAPDVPDLAAAVLTSARQAQTLVSRLSDSGRVPDCEPMELRPVVEEAVQGARRPGLQVSIRGQSSMVLGDPVAIARILTNLLVNAMEAGGSHIQIELDGTDVRVSDDGSGVPESVRSLLFEAPVSTRGSGRGVGLLGARALARRMEGDLCYRPHQACFELSLRRAEHA